jgi:hypothetical protein
MIGDYGYLVFRASAPVYTNELVEHMTTVRVINCGDSTKKMLAVLETNTTWGYNVLKKASLLKDERTMRVICVGSYHSKKKKRRYLVFRLYNPNEEEY